MINELIEQIGGRERLEKIASWSEQSWSEQFGRGSIIVLPVSEAEAMARALLAVLDAQEKPAMQVVGVIGAGVRAVCYEGAERPHCGSLLYTTPPAATVPEGWQIVAYTDAEEMRLLRGGTSAYMFNRDCFDVADRIALYAISPAPGGE